MYLITYRNTFGFWNSLFGILLSFKVDNTKMTITESEPIDWLSKQDNENLVILNVLYILPGCSTNQVPDNLQRLVQP